MLSVVVMGWGRPRPGLILFSGFDLGFGPVMVVVVVWVVDVCDLGSAVFCGFEHMTGLGVGLWVVGSVS